MLSIEHLYFSYQGQPPYVLKDLNLHIHSGDYISIVGDNGCGKSTLSRLIAGIEKPSAGDFLYQGKIFDFKKNRKDVQLILQNSIESFSPRMKIKQFLYFL